MAQFERLQSVPVGAVSQSEPARAGLSREVAPKVDPHTQGVLQIKKGVGREAHINLFKVGCSCGRFVGCWQSSPQLAFSSHARHVNGARVEFR